MGRLSEIRSRQAELQPLIGGFADRDLTEDEQRSLDAHLSEWDSLVTEAAPLEARAAQLDAVRSVTLTAPATRSEPAQAPSAVRHGAPNVISSRSAEDLLNDRNASGRQLTGAILRSNESHLEDMAPKESARFRSLIQRHGRSDERWARNMLGRSTEIYADAFSKVTTGREAELTSEERAAIVIGTNTAGGYLVPTFLDPTLIITNDRSSGVVRSIPGIRHVTMTTGNVWNGVTSDGVTASWDGELEEVSDDSPAFGSQSIRLFKGQAFVQASIEAFEDIAGLEADVRLLMANAKEDLESPAYLVGGGTNNPLGIFTALHAVTARRVVTQTAAQLGELDLHNTYQALRDRHRNRAVWLMATQYGLAIKRLGTAVNSAYSGDLREGPDVQILDRPRYLADDAPTTQTTTALDDILAFFNPSEYIIVDKPGSYAVEFIPHLFNTNNNRPDGRRGWYGHWRSGAGMPNPKGGVVLVDKTSA